MPLLLCTEYDGAVHRIQADSGLTVMQAILEANIAGMLGDCGGSCSCGTCHAYIDPAWLARLPPPDQTEVGMLEYIIDPLPNSRLTCQLRLTDKLDGLTLRLPHTQI